MKEKAFIKKFKDIIGVPIYYSLDEKGNVVIDEDSIREEFDDKLEVILNITGEVEE